MAQRNAALANALSPTKNKTFHQPRNLPLQTYENPILLR
jgi:hypothetical protein